MNQFDCQICRLTFTDTGRSGYVSAECPHCHSWDTRSRVMISLDANIVRHNTYAWGRDLDRENHRKDIIQPTTKNGTLNEDFERAYGRNPYTEKAKPYARQQQQALHAQSMNEGASQEVENAMPVESLSQFKNTNG